MVQKNPFQALTDFTEQQWFHVCSGGRFHLPWRVWCAFSRQGCAKLIDFFFSFLLSESGQAALTWIKYKQKENSH